jgi:hypothetical protein
MVSYKPRFSRQRKWRKEMGKGLNFDSLIADPRQEIVKRWDREGFLEGIEDAPTKVNTALVLENQFSYLTEDGGTSIADVSVMKKLTIPMVRRVFPGLIAHDLVAVQPMSGPVGLAYALRRHRLSQYGGVEINGVSSDPSSTNYQAPADRYANIEGDVDKAQPDSTWTGPVTGWAGERIGEDSKLFDSIDGAGGPTTYAAQEVGISVISKEIRAWTRKLRARFPIEVQQDLNAMHNIDIRRELTDVMSYEITAEIDQEVLAAIKHRARAGGTLTWNYNVSADGRWQIEKYRTLMTVINNAANEIAVANRIGAGNFIIASPRVCSVLESLPEFTIWTQDGKLNTLGTAAPNTYIGTIGRYKVYRDIFATENYCVVGYKGTSTNDAGIIYAPYVPVMFDEAKGPESFHTHLGVLTRYAIVSNMFGSELYYRYIEVSFAGDVSDSTEGTPAGDPFSGYERTPKEEEVSNNWDSQGPTGP